MVGPGDCGHGKAGDLEIRAVEDEVQFPFRGLAGKRGPAFRVGADQAGGPEEERHFAFAPQGVEVTRQDDRAVHGADQPVEAFKLLDKPRNEVCAVFTVQEEVGLRGATTSAYALEPDIGIALDVTPAGDMPKAARMTVGLGKGIAVKVMDNAVICHPTVRARMEEAAKDAGIPYQLEVLTAGGTDSGAIHLSRGGVPSGVLSIPCRYVHSPAETIDLGDLEGGIKLLAKLMNEAW